MDCLEPQRGNLSAVPAPGHGWLCVQPLGALGVGEGCGDLESCRRQMGVLTRDVASQGHALAVLVLEGGGDGVQPQEEKGLWAQGGEGHS